MAINVKFINSLHSLCCSITSGDSCTEQGGREARMRYGNHKLDSPGADSVPPQAVRGDHMKIQYVISLSSTTNPKPKGQPCSVLPRTIWGDQF